MRVYVIVSGLVLVFLSSLYGLYELASDFQTSLAIARLDERATQLIQSWRSPALDVIMKIITYSAGIVGGTLLSLALFVYLRYASRRPEATTTAILVVGGVVLANGLKPLLQRMRPAEAFALINTPASSSFPSGHSMTSFCWAVAAAQAILLAPFASPVTKAAVVALCAVWAVAVGLSRIYLGVHYPSDVLAAWLLGLAWMSVITGIYYWLRVTSKGTVK